MQIPQIRIDLNDRDKRGFVPANISDAIGPLEVGEPAIVYEPDDSVWLSAEIREIDAERGIVWLDVDWSDMHDWPL